MRKLKTTLRTTSLDFLSTGLHWEFTFSKKTTLEKQTELDRERIKDSPFLTYAGEQLFSVITWTVFLLLSKSCHTQPGFHSFLRHWAPNLLSGKNIHSIVLLRFSEASHKWTESYVSTISKLHKVVRLLILGNTCFVLNFCVCGKKTHNVNLHLCKF